MPSSKLGTLHVDLFLNMAQFFSGIDQAPKALSKLSKDLSKIGKEMSVAITAPLVGIGTAAFAAANKVDEAMDSIRAATGATGARLQTLEKDFKAVAASVPSSLEDASKAIGDLNQRLGLTGAPLQELAKQELNLARLTKSDLGATIAGTTRVFEKFGVATADQGKTLDTLFKISQKTGTGIVDLTSNLTAGGAALHELGFGLTESAVLLAQFQKTGIDTGPVLAALKKGVVEFAKAGIDAPQALASIISSIQNAGSAAKANAIAIQFFGAKAGLELATAIKVGRLSIDEIVKSINDSHETINQAARETESFSEKWQLLKNRVVLALEPLGKELLNVFEHQVFPVLTKAIQKLQDFADGFAKLEPQTKSFILGLSGTIALLGPLAIGIAGITAAISTLTKAGTFLFATPWGLAILGISAAVASGVLVWEKYSRKVEEAAEHQRSLTVSAHAGVVAMASAHASVVAATAHLGHIDVELEAAAAKLVEAFHKQRTILPEVALAIHRLAAEGQPLSKIFQEFKTQLDAVTLSADPLIKKLQQIAASANAAMKAVTAPSLFGLPPGARPVSGEKLSLGPLFESSDKKESLPALIARAQAQSRELVGRLQSWVPPDTTLIDRLDAFRTWIDTQFRAMLDKSGEMKTIIGNAADDFERQLREGPQLAIGQINELASRGVNLGEIYKSFGGILDEYPEKLDATTKALLEMGKIQTLLKDGWINIGRTIEQSVSRAVQSFKNMRDALHSIFNSIKQAVLQMIGDVIGSLVRNLFSPLLQGLAGALPLALGAGGAGAGGLGSIGALPGLLGAGGTSSGGGIAGLLKGLTGGAGGLAGLGNAGLALGGPIGLAAALSGNKGALIGGGIGAGLGGIFGFLGGFGGLAGALHFGALLGPIGAAVGLGVDLLFKAFTKTVEQKGALEVARDLGGISIGSGTVGAFIAQNNISQKQFEGIRKDILSSPKFLTEVAFPLAQQQGKVADFLKSLESIQTVFGTFNFRTAFEKGLKSGNFAELNKAFEDAFKNSKALVQLIPDFATRLAAATNGAVDQTLVRTRLTVKPVAVSPNAQPVLPGSGFVTEQTAGEGIAVQVLYSPQNTVIDAEGLAKLEREKIFPDFVRHMDGNIGEIRAKVIRILGLAKLKNA